MELVNLDLMHAKLLQMLLEFLQKPFSVLPVSCPTVQTPMKISKN